MTLEDAAIEALQAAIAATSREDMQRAVDAAAAAAATSAQLHLDAFIAGRVESCNCGCPVDPAHPDVYWNPGN